MGSHSPQKRSQLSLDLGCHRSFLKPCSCHPPHSALAQPHKRVGVLSRRAEEAMGLGLECPPRARRLLSLGTFCFHFIYVPGTQLLSNWIKLSQNAGIAPLTGQWLGYVLGGAVCQTRWPHNTHEGIPMPVLVFLSGLSQGMREFGPHAWQALHCS